MLIHLHLTADILNQKIPAFDRSLDVKLLHLRAELLQNPVRGLDTHVTHDHDLFQLLVEIIINRSVSQENTVHSGNNIVTGLRQTAFQSGKKTKLFLFVCHPNSVLPAAACGFSL